MLKRIAFIIGLAVIACIALVGIVLFVTRGVAQGGDDFMKALQEQRMDEAYAMLSTELQAEVTEGSFREMFAGAGLTGWNFTSRNVETNNGITTGSVGGTATVDGREFSVQLDLVKQNDAWRVIAFDFSPSS